ncbi:M23 family metallopeptidase [Geobacter pickeringii]|uniref:Peptidase M23 n=1 Tax=Geobacter pickeringii TaxID=345632 RepID=A0A0B5BJL3_9BACT|nr:M23 family metallopeptidase [Geobacter pickeringii]AJE04276.1 peptidase M23 [Geobacter pickeringii]
MKRFIFLAAVALMAVPAMAAARRLPVDGGTITSGIGWRPDPFGSGRMVYHHGVDIAVPEGTSVYPTQTGTVIYAGLYKGYGNLVAIDHGNGYITIYGHNASVRVKAGDRVDEKTVIALSGNTGRSTGPHVHYEVRQIPVSDRQRREAQARLEERLKEVVSENVGAWIAGHEQGQGGEATSVELALPTGDEP